MERMSQYAEWNSFTTYSANDIVAYLGGLYLGLLTPNLNHVPPSSPTFWAQIGGGGVVNTVVAGQGIAVVGTNNPIVSTNITSPNAGLTITAGTGTEQVFTNTGVLGLTAGSGISLSGTNETGITISATGGGVASIEGQTGAVDLTSSGGSITITNPTPGTINLEAAAAGVASIEGQTGVVDITSANGSITITTPTPGTINLQTAAAPAGIQWNLLKADSGASPGSGSGVGFYSTGSWPTNNAATLLIKFSFSDIVITPPVGGTGLFNDTSIQMSGGGIYQLTTNDWLYPFYDTPQTSGIYRTFSYTYVIPAGLGGTAQNITTYVPPAQFSSTWATEFWLQY